MTFGAHAARTSLSKGYSLRLGRDSSPEARTEVYSLEMREGFLLVLLVSYFFRISNPLPNPIWLILGELSSMAAQWLWHPCRRRGALTVAPRRF